MRRSANVPVPAGMTRRKFQQPYSRALGPEACSTYDRRQQKLMVFSNPLEILAEKPIRNFQADGREEEGIRSGHRTRRESSGPCLVDGEVGFSELWDIW